MSMTQEPTKALELFYSYAHTDERWRRRLEIHLSNLQRQGFIVAWHDRNISAGTTWASEIDTHLNTADIILLLISPDFIASEYCYSIEMKRAMERHQAGEARVIPVILRPTDWEGTPFKQLQALPTNARAVTRWQNRDDALLDVVNGIREAVKELLASPSAPLTPRSSSQDTFSSAPASSTSGEKRLDITAMSLKPEPIWKVPTTFTLLIGRDQDVSTACALLSRPEVRLLTLLGTGGIGKTRLAIHIATEMRDAFPDGVCFVPLATINDPTLVVPTIAQELDIQETGAQPVFEHLKTSLRDRHILLILDNFEQIVTARSQVEELLAACQMVTMLVTSRIVLGIQGEQEFQVPPLALPDLTHLPEHETLSHYAAISLFLQRARAVLSSFELAQDNARAIAQICARLDGLPLAIELAAARIRVLPPQALLTRLSQRLQVLTGGARTAPARQQTLRNTIAWSYNLLADQEQRLFRQLSVFVGGCTLEAAEAVCSSSNNSDVSLSVLDGVSSLVEQSLLQQTEQEREEPRYMMLETVREYGLECLRESGEAEASQRAHALYYLAFAEEAEPHLKGAQQVAWWKRLEQEQKNLRAALDWLSSQEEGELVLRLSIALWWFWNIRGHWSEGRSSLEKALAHPQAQARTARRAKALFGADTFDFRLGRPRAPSLLEESVTIYRELGEKYGLAEVLSWLGLSWTYRGNLAAARKPLEDALALAREVGDPWLLAKALRSLGTFMIELRDVKSAHHFLEESVTLFREVKDQRELSFSLRMLTEIAMLEGNPTQATALAQESLRLARELEGMPDITRTLYLLAEARSLQGDVEQAVVSLEECLALARDLGDKSQIASALLRLGKIRLLQGDLTQARAIYTEAVLLAREIENHYSVGTSLIALAEVTAAEGQPEQAARLFGAAEPRISPRTELDPFELADYERVVEGVQARLGEKVFATAWAEGRAMSPEQVLAAMKYTDGS